MKRRTAAAQAGVPGSAAAGTATSIGDAASKLSGGSAEGEAKPTDEALKGWADKAGGKFHGTDKDAAGSGTGGSGGDSGGSGEGSGGAGQ